MRNELNTPLVNNGRNDDFLGDVYSFAKRTACQMLSTFDTIPLWERDEIAEDAAVDVLGKLHRFDPNRGAKVTTWAYKVVERFILNRTESLKRRQFYTAVNRIDIDSPIGKLLPDEEPDDVETNEVRELVRTTLNSLPRKARQVADMMQEGRTTEEMTERLQITDGALYAHTFRIRNEVTSTLRKNGYMEGPVRRTRDRGTREGSAVLLLCTRLHQAEWCHSGISTSRIALIPTIKHSTENPPAPYRRSFSSKSSSAGALIGGRRCPCCRSVLASNPGRSVFP